MVCLPIDNNVTGALAYASNCHYMINKLSHLKQYLRTKKKVILHQLTVFHILTVDFFFHRKVHLSGSIKSQNSGRQMLVKESELLSYQGILY